MRCWAQIIPWVATVLTWAAGQQNVEVPCSTIFSTLRISCLCSVEGALNSSVSINCDYVSFARDFPLLPRDQRIQAFLQRHTGLQDLEAQLFTASDIPLRIVDFSHNLLRHLEKRVFEGIEDTLEELLLGNNKLGDQQTDNFSTGEFRRMSRLRILDLSNNELRALQPGIFNDLVSLEELRLHNNELNEIPTSTFEYLESLRILHLQHNYLTDIPQTAFPALPSLTVVNLTCNDIITVHNHAFSNLGNLNVLLMAYNRIRALTPDAFEGLFSLETLDLSNNFIEIIPMTSLQKVPSIKRLILHSNKIKSLEGMPLSHLHALEYLDLSRNSILGVSPKMFSNMSSLKELHLDINIVRKVSREMFSGLGGLRDLSLNDNRILTFPSETTFSAFTHLRKLSMNYNRIAAVSGNILAPVSGLEELSLAFNLISEIPDETFRNFNNLQLLNLHGNKINDFGLSKTEGLEGSLLYLDIGYNDITSIPNLNFAKLVILTLSRNQLTNLSPDTFHNLRDLKYLNISYNKLETLPPSLFYGLNNLESLDIQRNFITNIVPGTVSNLPVKNINLHHNRLSKLQQHTFQNLPHLETLDISSNMLSSIEAGALDGLTSLKELNLRDNQLTMIKGDMFTANTRIEILDLSQNKITYLYPNSFTVHGRLKKIDLSKNEITLFPKEITNSIQSLIEINLANNKLNSIPDGLSNKPNLRVINLQNNAITGIEEQVFQNSSQLRWINLRSNQISFLDGNTFNGITKLNLDLSFNNLSSLPRDIFNRRNGLKLESINLAKNMFRDFPTSSLEKQYAFLEKANLSYNQITSLPSQSDVLGNIKELDLSYNPLSNDAHRILLEKPSVRVLYLSETGVNSLPVTGSPFLKVLDLSGNQISIIRSTSFQRSKLLKRLDLSKNIIPNLSSNLASVWSKLPRLEKLDLSGNPIKYISKTDLSHLPHLRELKMTDLPQITEFDCEVLRSLPKLRTLHLYGYDSMANFNVKQCLQPFTGLESLYTEIKDRELKDQLHGVYSPRLKEVGVSGRSLRSISSGAFAGMHSPVLSITLVRTGIANVSEKVFLSLPLSSKIILNVPNNHIRRLNPELLAVLDNKQVSIDFMGLDANPITCDCNMQYLRQWVQDRMAARPTDESGVTTLKCVLPPNLQGQPVQNLQVEDLVCGLTTYEWTTPTMETTRRTTTTTTTTEPGIIYHPPSTTRRPTASQRNSLTKVDTMIIGIVAGVVAFVCILIIIICIIRLRQAKPHYTAGPLAGPLALRAQGKCTCLKPPPSSCTCYPMYPVTLPYSLPGPPPHQKMLPAPPGVMTTMGRPKHPPYYVTYPDSDNENR